MKATTSEASTHNGPSKKTCPDCSTKMDDLGDRYECPSCKFTLMKGNNPL